jgi:acyl dehydratase
MPADLSSLMAFRQTGVRADWAPSDASLYALSVGAGRDPLDRVDLGLVLETRGPAVLPTMAAVIVRPVTRLLGLDTTGVLHLEQRLALLRPIPPQGVVVSDARVVAVVDKGPGRGAIVTVEFVARLEDAGEPLFVMTQTVLARGDGGCGGSFGPVAARHPIPDRAPDLTHQAQTRPDQALLYRLNGDLNPLHADPDAAQAAGFAVPILHGLCTWGFACHAIVTAVSGHDPARIAAFDARFTAPVYPGDTIVTDIWVDGSTVSFRARAPGRDVVVLDNGRCQIGPKT